MRRRRFLHALGLLGLSPGLSSCLSSIPDTLYPAAPFGNATLLHFTDCHAQLLPVYYREPSINIGTEKENRHPPHLTGQDILNFFGLPPGTKEAYAFTHLDFAEAAAVFGKLGGFAHLATLIEQVKRQSAHGNFLLLDGGDTWQGSATSLWTHGEDMVSACNLLGVDVMTGHWEFTHGSNTVNKNIQQFNGEFLAHNIALSEEAQFSSETESASPFKSYTIKPFGNVRIAIIGQAYPYTPIANPTYLIPDWQFGIREQQLQQTINEIKEEKRADAIVLLSHNGLDIDLKLAARVTGIDLILGGHTHDAIPKPFWIANAQGKTCVTNAGSHGKFLAVVDLSITRQGLRDLRYRLLPVFSNLLEPDREMLRLINNIRQPYLTRLEERLGVADRLLYRRDTYQGSFDRLLLDALQTAHDTPIAFSPGFRWGTTLLPGQAISYEEVMNQTAITYPGTYRRILTGREIKTILEDAADNLFNPDPYYRQGGDMVRTGGLSFRCNPDAETGRRIDEMRLADGTLLEADKSYAVAGWASVKPATGGKSMSEVLSDYLKNQ